ncbi:membrane protein [Cellvibrio zantedeschiae]|uniref:Ancillary SecYEG translocon subunit n=1 Tax=Cellvibrio zantedeschiae TaxID=1237077 RepID=A0ABQ3AT61_9GAMM|nr:tetratricopeptide repeat protein [Cellvibrio zantedeschiae]GGY67002.1 membrane protein [Cellvibrio zantedeschiae]
MSVHLTEEEQLEVLKRWWKDYGKTVITGIVAAVALYFAWTTWQEKQRNKAESASAHYEELIKILNVEQGKTLSEADKANAEHIANELKEKNGKTLYAQGAAFYLAKSAVDAGNLDKAVTELQWILASKPDIATAQLAHARLARVYVAKGAYPEALAQLSEEPSKAFASEYAEVRGDILKAQGNKDAAATAYKKALETTDPQQQERAMVLQMKADELKSADVAPATPATQEKAQ